MKTYQQRFLAEWNMPNYIGAIDGKHITLQAPRKSGSIWYFNYKRMFSIVLMAACDSKYKFTMFGAFDSESNEGILSKSVCGKALYEGNLNFLKGKICLSGSEEKTCLYLLC